MRYDRANRSGGQCGAVCQARPDGEGWGGLPQKCFSGRDMAAESAGRVFQVVQTAPGLAGGPNGSRARDGFFRV